MNVPYSFQTVSFAMELITAISTLPASPDVRQVHWFLFQLLVIYRLNQRYPRPILNQSTGDFYYERDQNAVSFHGGLYFTGNMAHRYQ
jgi:hypothetical protein